MITANILNIIGLSFDIVGVLMLFKFGIPPMIERGGAIFLVAEENNEEEKKKAKIYDYCSYTALFFLVLGFGFQILANFPNLIIRFNHLLNCV